MMKDLEMNIATAETMHSELSLKLINAIQDPQNWSDVLDWIIKFTGAKAAIITLRDKENCQIINDVDLEANFHSPLIRGFSHEAIVHYMTNLRTIDPWASFQKTYYPHHPVQMSKVCPTDTIKETRFFDWLSSEGFEDTIVFELDRMAGYWTAINLFLETPIGKEAEQVLAFANANYELLRSSWQTSQKMAGARQANKALLERAASGGAPVCLVGANGEMIECNELFRELLETDAVRLSGIKQKLSFAHAISVHGLDRWEQHEFLGHVSDADPLLLLASPVDPDPLFADRREQLWLLTCSNKRAAQVSPSIAASFNLDALTRQERTLYENIAAGQSVAEAGSTIGLKRSRAFEVWSSVKEKLGISSAHKLRS
jgi:hypothetical protein